MIISEGILGIMWEGFIGGIPEGGISVEIMVGTEKKKQIQYLM